MFNNGNFETLLPYFFRCAPRLNYYRERVYTRDNDFLDLDWLKQNSSKLVILSHGLESSSQAKYIRGMAKVFFDRGFDVLAWNYRGCSGEINQTLSYYHSGATQDLEEVISHTKSSYESINLIGFSLGGNLTLKYIGERGSELYPQINKAIAISAPVCLKTSSYKLKSGFNKVYTQNFLKTLKQKIYAKEQKLKAFGIDPTKVEELKNLPEFDDVFTGPIHGFKDGDDYYKKSSSKQFLKYIKIPTLILNAKNDPFLSNECFPYEEVANNANLTFLDPDKGGHVGFFRPFNKFNFYSEEIAANFIK